MKVKIYTTSNWFKKDLPFIIECVSQSGAKPEIEVEKIKLPNLPAVLDPDGAIRPDWDWLKANIFEPGYNAVCLHITRKERDRFGLTHPDPNTTLGGSYDVDQDNVLESNDWNNYKADVLCIEGFSYPYLEQFGYERVFWDGCNCYYKLK